MHLVDGDVGSEVLVEAGHHVPLRVVVVIVVSQREDLGEVSGATMKMVSSIQVCISLTYYSYLGVHAELDRALCEVGGAREDRGDGGGSVRECLGSKDLVGLAEHACRGRVGGAGGGRVRRHGGATSDMVGTAGRGEMAWTRRG